MEVRRRIGYLPENPPLYHEMTVRGFLRFVAKIKGVKADRRQPVIDDVIGKCRLEDVAHRIIGKLSKGYKQRVGLAQSLLNDPAVLILDEPTIGLDPKQINDVRQLIKGLAGTHTVILSTHILPEVSITCNRVAIIHKGKIIAVDTPEKLTSKGRIRMEVEGASAAVTPVINGIPGVTNSLVVKEGNGICNIDVESELVRDIRKDLSAAVVKAGFGLLGLRMETVSLEDVFINLVTSEDQSQSVS
jgi:ABC-2 type transport system ATP-binding protein